MSNVQYTLVTNGEDTSVVVFVPGHSPKVAHASNIYFDQIVAKAKANDPSVIDLFDLAEAAAKKFMKLTERVSTRNSKLFLDGVEMHGVLEGQVVEFIRQGVEDWKPLVAFLENLAQNPNEHSRGHLYRWLQADGFTITESGLIVGYKGVFGSTLEDGTREYASTHAGYGIVDGVEYQNSKLPSYVGSVVEMPRDMVTFDPYNACSVGLHVGTHDYARGYGDTVLEVHVNPRDVVSVPTDADDQKMRVCRYLIVREVETKYSEAVISDYESDDDCGYGEDNDDNDEAVVEVPEEVTTEAQGVKLGDQFSDRDPRRQRVLTVTGLNGGVTATVLSDKGVKSEIKLERLLSASRFDRI